MEKVNRRMGSNRGMREVPRLKKYCECCTPKLVKSFGCIPSDLLIIKKISFKCEPQGCLKDHF